VLMGLEPGDWPRIRQLVIEVDQQEHLEPVTALLERHGFEVLVEQDPLLRKTALCYVYAIRPSAAGRLIRHQAADAHLRLLPVNQDILAPVALRKFLKDRLPQYMIPSAFVLMERFPLTSNGKVDRKAFPALVSEPPRPAHDSVRPRTETEKALAAIWTELLDVQHVGLDDDFFDLGGQSLVAIKAVSRIRDTFEVNLALRNLFEYPTVAGLAAVIDRLSWVAEARAPTGGGGDREEIEL